MSGYHSATYETMLECLGLSGLFGRGLNVLCVFERLYINNGVDCFFN
jgi:hypothetical protein